VRPGDLLREIHTRLRAAGVPERRQVARWYFPSALRVLGVPTPEMRRIARDVARRLRAEPPGTVLALCRALVEARTLEGRAVAYEVLARHAGARSALTARWVERLGAGNDNWGSVDHFACTVAGPAWREGAVSDAMVQTWARAKDRWWRRTALVATVALNAPSRGGRGDAPRTLAVCQRLAADPDEMIVKALSWALRELLRHDPAAVTAFLGRHREVLHPRVVREVTRKRDTGRKGR
jgi:3-methyladenine DNA glycosylase AlkD